MIKFTDRVNRTSLRVVVVALLPLVAGTGTVACTSAPTYQQGEVIATEDDDDGELELRVWLDGRERVVDVVERTTDCDEGDRYPRCNSGRLGSFDDEELSESEDGLPDRTTKTTKTTTRSTKTTSRPTR